MSVQDVRLISLTPLAGSRGQIATALARAIGDDDLLMMLSGPEGSGKSAVLAAVAATLSYGGMRTIRVSNPDGSTMGQRELAARILGRPTMGSPAQLVAEAITSLIATTDNGQVVLVVDDAHTLTDQAMELLLVISSPVRPGGSGPQLILAGRGAFWDRPWRDELKSLTDLAEKIALEPLTIEDARDFVMAEAAAAAGTVISVTPDALTALVRCSSGLAAGMNRIVTEAVVLGNHRQVTVLTEEIVDAVVTPDTLIEPPCTDTDLPTPRDAAVIVPDVAAPEPVIQKKPRGRWPAIAATAVIALAGASVGLVPSLRTQVATLFGGSAPEAARSTSPVTDAPTGNARASDDTTAAEPPKAAVALQSLPAHETIAASENPSTPAASEAAAAPADTLARNAAEPSVAPTSPHDMVANGETPATLQASGDPKAPVESSAGSAPRPGTLPNPATVTTETPRGIEQESTPVAAPTDTTTGTQAAAARLTDATKPETVKAVPAVPPVATAAGAPLPIAPPPPALLPPAAPAPAAPPATAAQTSPLPTAVQPTVAPPTAALPSSPLPTSTGQQTTASLPASVISVLLQHGNEKLALGDILSARLYFERAGAAGNEDGAMGAARTYDPGYLSTIDAPGLQADVKRAIDWYRIAVATSGNREAQARIDTLTAAATR